MRKTGFIVIVIALATLIGLWFDASTFLSSPLKVPAEGMSFEVKQGSNLTRVAHMLSREGVLKKPRYLIWYARWIRHADKISIGEYHIDPGTTPKTLLTNLLEGKVIQYSITLVDGWTFAQALQVIRDNPYLEHRLQGLSPTQIMDKLGHPGENPEGRFMPDTYNFPRGLSDLVFLQRAYDMMQEYLKQAWGERDVGLPLKTPYQALILASIVEKETGLAKDRPEIAGVFIRRLQKNMRLQSDPTIIYGMGDEYKGNIRRQDLRRDNPYNTYERAGLPPTPIALPGRAAIQAVLHPAGGDALYFVSRGDGSHQFSATLEEHNKAVIKYQLKGRAKPFSSFRNNSGNKQQEEGNSRQ